MTETLKPTGLALLRAPFPANQISKLPKESRAQADDRKARKQGCVVWKCPECGGAHHKDATHLDYVGHAALTDRLLDCDPHWYWEPYVADGLPNAGNGMWIKLHVCGQSQIGYGHADGKQGGDAIKEIIGDALRNAAMRFGAALDLWHKGDLHLDESEEPAPAKPAEPLSDAQWMIISDLIGQTNTDAKAFCDHYKIKSVKELPVTAFDQARKQLNGKLAKIAAELEAAKSNDIQF
jgi:hypothetical protein